MSITREMQRRKERHRDKGKEGWNLNHELRESNE